MPICPSGSTTRSGFGGIIHIDPANLDTILPPALAWLRPFTPYMRPLDIDVSALCGDEPPGWPTFDPLDLLNLIKPNKVSVGITVATKVGQIAEQLLWYQMCECLSPDPPAVLPTPPAAPADAPVFNPPALVSPPNSIRVCATGQATAGTTHAWVLLSGAPRWTARLLSSDVDYLGSVGWGFSTSQPMNPAGPTDYPSSWGEFAAGGWSAVGETSSGTWAHDADPTIGTYAYVSIPNTADADLDTSDKTVCVEFSPTNVVRTDCATDPRLLGLLEQIYALLTGVQRSYAPFGYIKGTSHSGISGTGSVSVDRIIGVELDVDAGASGHTVLLGNPSYVKDLGWLSVSEADGMIQERRVAQLHFTWFPQVAPIATAINYALTDGVVVTLTELLPEP